MISGIVGIDKSDDGVWLHVKSPDGAVGVFNIAGINSPLVRHAFLGWAEASLNAKPLACGHPKQCLGKVNDDNPNEKVHCLWCGDITDLNTLAEHVTTIYEHVSGGKVSKPLTLPSVVIALADDQENARTEEAIAEAAQELRDRVHAVADQIWQGLLDQSAASDALYAIAGVTVDGAQRLEATGAQRSDSKPLDRQGSAEELRRAVEETRALNAKEVE